MQLEYPFISAVGYSGTNAIRSKVLPPFTFEVIVVIMNNIKELMS